MLSIALLVFSFFPMLLSIPMTVTPQATTYFGGSKDRLELNKCYNQSIIPSGPYRDFCVDYRKCLPLPAAVGENVYFQEVEGIDTISFKSIDDHMKLFLPLFKGLLRLNRTENTTNCIKYATAFMCGAFYPMCFTNENNEGEMKHTLIPPCRYLCLSTEEYCKTEMLRLNYKWEEANPIFNCTRYEETEKCTGILDDCGSENPDSNGTESQPAEPTTITVETPELPTEATELPTEAATEPPTERVTEPPTAGQIVPPATNPPATNPCAPCKKIRKSFHQKLVKSGTYDFLAYVSVSSKAFPAMLNVSLNQTKTVVAFNVTVVDNYDIACTRTNEEPCGSTVTVYTDDEHDDNDCRPCIGKHIPGPMSHVTIGGTFIDNGKWLLNGREIRCIFSPQDKASDVLKWMRKHPCRNGSERNSCYIPNNNLQHS